MHSGDAASCRRCWDKTTSLPAQTAKLYRGSNSLASAERKAGPRHVISKCK